MSAEILRSLPAQTSEWFTLDADRVQVFADATEDWQFIHLDEERAAQTPFGGTVAHGFLTLSMLSAMSYQIMPPLADVKASINYGFDRIRFVSPVRVGSRVRGRFSVAQVDEAPGHLTVHWDVLMEVENSDKPALVAAWITRLELEE